MSKVYGVRAIQGELPFHVTLETGGLSREEHEYLVAKLQNVLVDFQYVFPRIKETVKEEYTE